MHHLRADDTCRNGHDGVAHQHDYSGKYAPKECCRSNVAIAYSRHCHDSPVNAGRYVGKWSVRNAAFHHVHKGSHTDDHDDHEEEEDANLWGADDDGTHQKVAFLQETEEFEHAENTDEAECTHYHKVANRAEYPSDVERQSAQQVNDSEET